MEKLIHFFFEFTHYRKLVGKSTLQEHKYEASTKQIFLLLIITIFYNTSSIYFYVKISKDMTY